MTTRNQLADHIATLSPTEFKQVEDLATYLAEKGSHGDSGRFAEGSMGRLLNSQPQRIQKTFKGMQEVIASPREMPFQPKRSERENMAQLNLDPDSGSTVMAALDFADVQQGIMDRMGTDSTREPEPLTTKDILSAAYDHHTESEGGDI